MNETHFRVICSILNNNIRAQKEYHFSFKFNLCRLENLIAPLMLTLTPMVDGCPPLRKFLKNAIFGALADPDSDESEEAAKANKEYFIFLIIF